jgi:hypothetical protein
MHQDEVRPGCNFRGQAAVLVVCDDPDILLVAQAVLAGSRRVLAAWNTVTALWVLRNFNVDSAVVQQGLPGSGLIHRECLARGFHIGLMRGTVEDGMVRLTLPEVPSTHPARPLLESQPQADSLPFPAIASRLVRPRIRI